MKNIYSFFIVLFTLTGLNTLQAQGIVINEILTSNTVTNTDEDDSYQDWVELYNSGATPVSLLGYGLTDDSTALYKWVFPNVTMAPGSYLLVWCSDKNRTVVGQPLHTNWKISSGGEVISLTNPGGTVVNSVPATAIPSDISYGRLPNGTGPFVFFQAVTPNAVNSATGYNEILNPPTFSQQGGFNTAAFNLTLSTATPGASIIYTVDGSEPDAANLGGTTYQYKNVYPEMPGDATGPLLNQSYTSLAYTGPINIVDRSSQPNKISAISSTYHADPFYIPESPIFKGTVVRAKVIKPGALSSRSASETYFVTPQGSSRFTLPVVSLSISEDKFYDYNDGIYVAGVDFDTWRTDNPDLEPQGLEDLANYYRRGEDFEREANMTYFVNGAEVINQNVGLRIHGGSSRDWQNKSFNVYSRAEYGDETMDYAFFPNQPTDFERLILRNSGADFFETHFRDALNMRLMKNLHVQTKGYQPTITFINGEYWGIMSFSDKFDNNYFKRVYDIDDVDVLESESVVEEGDAVHYQAMLDYMAANSLATQANYDYVATQMDPESFADYFIHNIFVDNIDWPGNNIVYWRKKTAAYEPNAPYGHDGRWRWLAHDMDATFGTNTDSFNNNTLADCFAPNGPEWPNPSWSTFLLRKLVANPGFKNYFINRFADLMNTTYLSPRVVAIIDEMKGILLPEMAEQIARWTAPVDMGDFDYYTDFEKEFATNRPTIQRNQIRNQFTIASNINATLNVSDPAHGFIKMNTINVANGTDGITGNPYPWTGIYFSNIPVTLKAVANPGFVFDHWTGASTSTNAEITLTQAASFAVTAVFVPDAPAAVSEPIYYWWMSGSIPNDTPLTFLNSSFEKEGIDAVIQYSSSFGAGYPFTSVDPNWRKGSMERRNKPTPLNYIPAANNGAAYVAGDMKGLQITQPFQVGALENTMVFNISSDGYEDIIFSFAAQDEGAATGISIDYSLAEGAPVWITTGLAATSFPLITNTFSVSTTDLSSIAGADDNPNLKIRLRFTGPDMTANAGNRVTFNNIAVHGKMLELAVPGHTASAFKVYPNPFSDVITVSGTNDTVSYRILTIDGKLVKSGNLDAAAQVNLEELTRGIYLLQLVSEGKTETKKLIKK